MRHMKGNVIDKVTRWKFAQSTRFALSVYRSPGDGEKNGKQHRHNHAVYPTALLFGIMLITQPIFPHTLPVHELYVGI